MKSIYPFVVWLDGTWINRYINESSWLFAAIEAVHIVALALLFGTVIVLNLALAGLMMRGRSLPRIAREAAPWTFTSLVVILVSGVLLFVSEAVKSFQSGPFQLKMALLLAAVAFHYAISWRLMVKETRGRHPLFTKSAAVFGLALWLGVGFAGRAIAFF
jgi:uncharacterized membrane protein